ncbi:uncharacterized protein LOC135714164 [Ochlerotatus camptorhynchus]|uniref:uncharacterized protein LOC135714164 n=1 Tax=Ochlerotatus camptorhynchus TaxID=644619 RepID=UPI0031D5BDBD
MVKDGSTTRTDYGAPCDGNPSAAKIKLPSLVVYKVPLNTLIGDLTSLGVTAEFKLGRIGTKVMLRTIAEYDVAVKYLKDSKSPGSRNQGPVQAGPNRCLPNDKEGQKREDVPDCLFLVHFQKGTVTLNALQAIRLIYFIIVRWEPYRGGHRDVTQCQRCLNVGHGTRNCNIKPRCSNYAHEHATSATLLPCGWNRGNKMRQLWWYPSRFQTVLQTQGLQTHSKAGGKQQSTRTQEGQNPSIQDGSSSSPAKAC